MQNKDVIPCIKMVKIVQAKLSWVVWGIYSIYILTVKAINQLSYHLASSLSYSKRNPSLSIDSFCRQLKTFLFDN